MKKIEAFVRHFKAEEIKEALVSSGIHGLSVTEVRGFGRQKGHKESYRGAEYTVDFVPKLKIELIVPDALADAAVSAILDAARTGNVGDGKVFVTDVDKAVRIRTGETGEEAL